MKRIISSLLVLVFALCAFTHAEVMSSAQKERLYVNTVSELETYLETGYDDVMRINAIKKQFGELGGYAKSREFASYAAVLAYIAGNDFGYRSRIELELLVGDADFERYIEKNFEDSPICSAARLALYYEGRSAENEGDTAAAAEKYREAGSFFDARVRLLSLTLESDKSAYDAAMAALNAGDFAGAYFGFMSSHNYNDDAEAYMKTITDYIGYTPENEKDNPDSVKNLKVNSVDTDSVTLSWDKAAHATSYTVEYRKPGNATWTNAGSTANTSYTVSGLDTNKAYDFRVTAYANRFETQGAQLTSVLTAAPTPTPTPKPTPTPTPKPTPTPTPAPKVKVGDIVTFGSYEQDNNTSNGKEPIEWEVLDIESDGTCLLISRYALDCRTYNKEEKDVTWESCTLRSWLKNTFYNNAFNTTERGKIVVTKDKNANNPVYGTQGGNDTSDYVFLLSLEEIEKNYNIDKNTGEKYYWYGEDRLIKQPTAYAIAKGAWYSSNNGACYWWLRSPGSASVYAASVDYSGLVDVYGYGVGLTSRSVVPAVRARLF